MCRIIANRQRNNTLFHWTGNGGVWLCALGRWPLHLVDGWRFTVQGDRKGRQRRVRHLFCFYKWLFDWVTLQCWKKSSNIASVFGWVTVSGLDLMCESRPHVLPMKLFYHISIIKSYRKITVMWNAAKHCLQSHFSLATRALVVFYVISKVISLYLYYRWNDYRRYFSMSS